MALVIDASIIGCACRNDERCYEILRKSKNYNICYTNEILKEYEALIKNSQCIKSNYYTFLKEWIIELISKYGRITKYSNNKINCLKRLIKRNKFKQNDVKYVKLAINCNGNIIVSDDYHFKGSGKRCIESIGVKVFDIQEAIETL